MHSYSRKQLVMQALEAIERSKMLMILRLQKGRPDLKKKMFTFEKELKSANCEDSRTDELLERFKLFSEEMRRELELIGKDRS